MAQPAKRRRRDRSSGDVTAGLTRKNVQYRDESNHRALVMLAELRKLDTIEDTIVYLMKLDPLYEQVIALLNAADEEEIKKK